MTITPSTITTVAPEIAVAPEVQELTTAAAPVPAGALTALKRFALSITAFNVIGHLWLGFEQAPITPIVTVAFAFAFAGLLEAVASAADGRPPAWRMGRDRLLAFALPVHISALACAMLLYGNAAVSPYLFAVAVGLSTKYLIRLRIKGQRRHVLNPSNTGIAVTLILFPWVGIAPPYQFTAGTEGIADWLIPLGILASGTMLNAGLTKRLPLILAWIGGFVLQAVFRSVVFDAALFGALVPLTGVAMILYTNYMITDPATTPSSKRGQIAFGLANAAIYGVLMLNHVAFGLFFALVITCGLRGLYLVVLGNR